MLIDYLGRPLCINCDWLSLSVKIDPTKPLVTPQGYRYEKLSGTNVYKHRYILYDQEGNKVLTFCCNPYSSVIPDDIATCQISNPYLYNPNPEELESLISTFFGAIFHGVSRWDVCCDFCPTNAEYKTIRKLMEGGQYVAAKSEGSIFWHSETYEGKETKVPHCMSWGSPTSAMKVKLYNKSLEIDALHPERCTKPYILNEWSYHLPDTTKVWRLEFSWTDVNQLAIDDKRLGLSDCLSSDILCRFFAEVKSKRFVVRMNQGRRNGHKNGDMIVPFLPFELGGCSIRKAQPMSERSELTEERKLARHLYMHLRDHSVLADAFRYQSLRGMLLDLAENPIVAGYLDRLCDGSFNSWLNDTDAMIGDGLFVID